MNRLQFLPPLGVVAMTVPALFAVLLGSSQEQIVLTSTKTVQTLESEEKNLDGKNLIELPEVTAIDTVFHKRPLFVEGRRVQVTKEGSNEPTPVFEAPETLVAVPASSPPPIPPEIELAGIVVDASGTRALIRNLVDKTETWMSEGQLIGVWTLAEISQVEVRLRTSETEIAFKLFPNALP